MPLFRIYSVKFWKNDDDFITYFNVYLSFYRKDLIMRFIATATMIAGMVFNSVFALEGLALQTVDVNKEFRGGKMYVHNMANGERTEIFSGHACGPSFSPDGKQISFIDVSKKKIMICDLDGKNLKEVSSISYGDLGVTYWLSDGYIYYNYHNKEIFRVKVQGGSQEEVYKSSEQIHQFGISNDGKRIAWSQPGWSVVVYDLETKKERNFGGACQGTMSPDGEYVTHNLGGHREVAIHNWDDKSTWKKLKCPEGTFNLHRWAHYSQDYIVYSIVGKATGYVHNVQTEKATKAGKGTIWDFWEGGAVSVSQPQYQSAPNMDAQGMISTASSSAPAYSLKLAMAFSVRLPSVK